MAGIGCPAPRGVPSRRGRELTTATAPSVCRGPRLPEITVFLAFVWGELVLVLLPPFPQPRDFLESAFAQAFFALALLHVVLSGRSWRSVGLSREGLLPSLVLGTLYSVITVGLNLVAIRFGLATHGTMIGGAPSEELGAPLAFALYLPFWGVFESIWMAYLIFTINRWLTGGYALTWRALFLASLWFGAMHVFTQVVWAGTPLPQALFFVLVGVTLLIPGTIPKLTGNAWGLVLWFTVTNFGI